MRKFFIILAAILPTTLWGEVIEYDTLYSVCKGTLCSIGVDLSNDPCYDGYLIYSINLPQEEVNKPQTIGYGLEGPGNPFLFNITTNTAELWIRKSRLSIDMMFAGQNPWQTQLYLWCGDYSFSGGTYQYDYNRYYIITSNITTDVNIFSLKEIYS